MPSATERSLVLALTAMALFLPISIAGTNIALGLVTIALLAHLASRRSLAWDRDWLPAVGCLGLYCAVAVLTALTAVAPAVSLHNFHKDLHKFWTLIILLPALRAVPARRWPVALWSSFVFVTAYGIAQSCSSSYQEFIIHGIEKDWLRAHAFVHPVTYGDMLALGFLGGLAWLGSRTSPKSTRNGLIFSMVLLSAALILNQTRGAFLGILAGGATLCIAEPFFRRQLKWGLPVAVLGAAAFALLPSHRSLITALWTPANAAGTNQQFNRLILWDVAWRIFRDHPWLGVGPANYGTVFTRYCPRIIEGIPVWTSAHDIFLQQLAERGLVGLVALLSLGGTFLARAWQRVRRDPSAWTLWALSSTVAFFVMNLTESAFQNEQITTLFLFIWALGETGPAQADPD